MTTQHEYRCTTIQIRTNHQITRTIPVETNTGKLTEPLNLTDNEEAWAVMTPVDGTPMPNKLLPYEWWAQGLPKDTP